MIEKWEEIAQKLTDNVNNNLELLKIVNGEFKELNDSDKILVVMFLCGVIRLDNERLEVR